MLSNESYFYTLIKINIELIDFENLIKEKSYIKLRLGDIQIIRIPFIY